MHNIIQQYKNFKAGYVTIIGAPNAGKSTLLNTIMGQKLSIVTPKAQTTRKNILSILNLPGKQIVFQDTPGIIKPSYKLQEIMMEYLSAAVEDADIVVYLVDATAIKPEKNISYTPEKLNKPVILVLNKIDLLDKKELLPIMQMFSRLYNWDAVIPVSALKKDGTDILLTTLTELLPINPPYYPEEYITDLPEKFFVAEIIREKIFHYLSDELPYSTHVEVEQFKERERGKYFIQATIYVERKSQKIIVIGKQGSMIKRIGYAARVDIEKFLDQKIYLELFVKIFADWRKKDGKLKTLGYR